MKAIILVVDDAEETRNLLRYTLEHEGLTVISVANGKEAASFLVNFKPDLIIADLVMPEFNGVDLIRFIRNQPSFADTPIVVISAFISYLEEAKRAGATLILQKPVDVIELPKILRGLLPQANGAYK
jgi:CheY-like chemotaxis protein